MAVLALQKDLRVARAVDCCQDYNRAGMTNDLAQHSYTRGLYDLLGGHPEHRAFVNELARQHPGCVLFSGFAWDGTFLHAKNISESENK